MLQRRPALAADRARCRAGAARGRRGAGHAKVENGLGRRAERLRADLRAARALAAAHAVPARRAAAALPLMRVVLVVTINGTARIDHRRRRPPTSRRSPARAASSQLVVKGKDLSALMDMIEIPGLPFPAMPPSVRVLLILAKYAALGVIPMVIPEHPRHPAAADRSRSRSSAAPTTPTSRSSPREAGYVFYLEPGPAPGTSKAYWGPEIRVGAPQPALTTDMDAQTNVEQLSFNFDKESEEDADRLLPGAVQQGADRHADPRHHAAQSAARPGAAAAAEDREARRHRATCRPPRR